MSTSAAHPAPSDWPLVSALFITYKRFLPLQRAVQAFREHTDYPNLEIIIADDGSPAEVHDQIRRLPADKFALSPKNRGLGANNNNGIRLCSGKYVLMIQDDWLCQGPPHYLRDAVAVMEANPQVGIINFAGANHPPDLNHRLTGGNEPCYLTTTPAMSYDGARELSFYTDQPHLQSMESIRHVGPYEELPMVQSENRYEQAWKEQTRYLTATFPAWHLKVFQCDYTPESYSAAMFSRRAEAKLYPTALWLKRHFKPVYRGARASFYFVVGMLEKLRIVK